MEMHHWNLMIAIWGYYMAGMLMVGGLPGVSVLVIVLAGINLYVYLCADEPEDS